MSGARLPRAVLWTPHHARATRGRLAMLMFRASATLRTNAGARRAMYVARNRRRRARG